MVMFCRKKVSHIFFFRRRFSRLDIMWTRRHNEALTYDSVKLIKFCTANLWFSSFFLTTHAYNNLFLSFQFKVEISSAHHITQNNEWKSLWTFGSLWMLCQCNVVASVFSSFSSNWPGGQLYVHNCTVEKTHVHDDNISLSTNVSHCGLFGSARSSASCICV